MKNELKKNDFSVSLEIFPPKKEEEFAGAFELLDRLALLNPDFISVTYGAGGSRSKKTVEMTSYIKNPFHIPALALSAALVSLMLSSTVHSMFFRCIAFPALLLSTLTLCGILQKEDAAWMRRLAFPGLHP